jgi:hypothetical protein
MSSSVSSSVSSSMSSSSSDGIFKGLKVFRISKVLELITNNSIQIDESVQRDQVSKHPSSPDLVLKSLSENIPIGLGVGYVNGLKAPTDQGKTLTQSRFLADFIPTPETPINLADFGHRYRFLFKIYQGAATLNGSTLAELQTRDPEKFERIMDTEIPFECVFHTSGTVPEEYIAKLFRALQLSAPASVGEKEKASSNRDLVSAGEALLKKFETQSEINREFPTERGVGRAIAHALIIGAADRSRMSQKSADFEEPLSQDQMLKSTQIIQQYTEILTNINKTLTQAEQASDAAVKECETIMKGLKGPAKDSLKPELTSLKSIHKSKRDMVVRYKKVKLDLALDGVFIVGLQDAPEQAIEYITRWWMAALETNEAWKNLSTDVKRNPGTARSFNGSAWLTKWGVLKTQIGENRLEITDSETVALTVV